MNLGHSNNNVVLLYVSSVVNLVRLLEVNDSRA